MGKSDLEIPVVVLQERDLLAQLLHGGNLVGDHLVLGHQRGIGLENEPAAENLRRLHGPEARALHAFGHHLLDARPLHGIRESARRSDAAPCARARSRQALISFGVTSGRAPSWIAMIFAALAVHRLQAVPDRNMPLRAAADDLRDLRQPVVGHQLLHFVHPSSRVTTRISSTSLVR